MIIFNEHSFTLFMHIAICVCIQWSVDLAFVFNLVNMVIIIELLTLVNYKKMFLTTYFVQ